MKHLNIALLTLTFSFVAVAQDTDPVAEQIRLTQDAVRIALNEVETNTQTQTLRSADGDAKLAHLRNQGATALRLFEERVRLRILMPLQILVSQYNETYRSSHLATEIKEQTLTNLYAQISEMALSRQSDYYQEVVKLHSPMGKFPVSVLISRNGFNGSFYVEEMKNGLGEVTKFDEQGVPARYTGSTINKPAFARVFAAHLGESLNQQVSLGCYTSTCFYQTLNQHVMWASLISTTLARDLFIKLADGKTITIAPEIKDRESFEAPTHHLLASSFLTQVKGNDAIFSLPTDIREDRLAALRSIDTAASAANFVQRSCVNTVRSHKNELCRSPSGCLTSTELTVMKARLSESRAACLDLRLTTPTNLHAALGSVTNARLPVLTNIEIAINAFPFNLRACQRTVRQLKRTLCNLPGQERCLTTAEKDILTQRLNNPSNSACL